MENVFGSHGTHGEQRDIREIDRRGDGQRLCTSATSAKAIPCTLRIPTPPQPETNATLLDTQLAHLISTTDWRSHTSNTKARHKNATAAAAAAAAAFSPLPLVPLRELASRTRRLHDSDGRWPRQLCGTTQSQAARPAPSWPGPSAPQAHTPLSQSLRPKAQSLKPQTIDPRPKAPNHRP
jgi:hypothetical protein